MATNPFQDILQAIGSNLFPQPNYNPRALFDPQQAVLNQVTQPARQTSASISGMPSDLAPVIDQAASANDVPPKYLGAIAKHESGGTFDPNQDQIGGGMGKGMFQIDIGQNPNITEQQAKNPSFAANYAAKMLQDNFKRYGNWDDAIKAYNAGDPYSDAPGYNGQPISELANQYLKKVKAAML